MVSVVDINDGSVAVSEDREGHPWMPEEDLLVMVEEPAPARAREAFEAIQQLRHAAIQVVTTHAVGGDIGEAITELEVALLAGVLPDEGDE